MAKRVAIIGAGASGICAIKACLDEDVEPTCFEITDHIGGLWHFKEDVTDDLGCVMKTTVINTSKEIMCYSDFPIPGSFPNFMHNTKLMEYFNLYVDNFSLRKHIRFNTAVISVKPAVDFDGTGRWEIESQEKKSSQSKKEIFDAVMLCTGHHSSKHMPSFPGEEDFEGKRLHTHEYRDHRGYEDKRVVVIGIGNSGGDVAVELSKICKQVFLSTRRGAWVFNRVNDNGVPMDLLALRRSTNYFRKYIPSSFLNSMVENKLNRRFNHTDYGLRPEHRFNAQHPTVNDELPNRIACGTVVIKSNVQRITKSAVEFDDGTVEDDIDVILYATGYKFGFPFVHHPGFEVEQNKPHLYKYMFPPGLSHPTIAAIGFFQPIGAINPIAEMQSRWAVRVFKLHHLCYQGLAKLPSKAEMEQEIDKKSSAMAARYVTSQRHTIQVDFLPFMDELAEQIGCKPDIWTTLFDDPVLAMKIIFGPCTPYQFRLSGPGSWPGAKEAILTQWDRVYETMKTRPVGTSQDINLPRLFILFLIAAFVLRFFISLIV